MSSRDARCGAGRRSLGNQNGKVCCTIRPKYVHNRVESETSIPHPHTQGPYQGLKRS